MRRVGRGFTLIEVLVTVVVVASGLLAASSLQVFSLRNTSEGYMRSQATALANDMAERIRANPLAVKAESFADLTTLGEFCQLTVPPDCQLEACEVQQLALSDFYEAGCQGVQSLLPEGTLSVACDVSSTDPLCSINVTWNVAAISEGEGTLKSVALRIQP